MREFLYISINNYLGGVDYWLFTGWKDHGIDVVETGETKKNIFAQWPKSYGQFADTINRQTFRRTRRTKVIRSQPLTSNQVDELAEQIKSSRVVQIITSRRDRRTVIVDNQSIIYRKEADKLHSLSFTITYTDDYS